jgi:Fe-S-cluster containining protein
MPAADPEAALKRNAITEVKTIYSELAAQPIERSCSLRTECCQFRLTGKTPHLTRGEALIAAKALRASGRKSQPERSDGACPMLDPFSSRCLIYKDRPFGCRTHFCAAAGGPYSRKDVLHLIHRLLEIDERLGGDGAHPIGDALSDALRTCH